MTVTFAPFFASSRAAVSPASPAPATRTELPRISRAASVREVQADEGQVARRLAFVLPIFFVVDTGDDLGARLDVDRRLHRDCDRGLTGNPRPKHAGRAIRQSQGQYCASHDGRIAWKEINAADGYGD